jgi:hypothetical protein
MEEVDKENLIVGKLYYIQCLTTDINGSGNGDLIPNEKVSLSVGVFIKRESVLFGDSQWNSAIFDWFCAKKISNLRNLDEITEIDKFQVKLNNMWRFYEVKKFKIQSEMEKKAVNSILKNITGDEFITWY